HEDGGHSGLLGGDALQAAEQHVRGGVRSRERDPQPAEERAEERVEAAGAREREAERRVRARVARDVAEREHGRDRDERGAGGARGGRGEGGPRAGEQAGVGAIPGAETPTQPPATSAAARMPLPVAESQLSVNTASSGRALATTGGTRSTTLSSQGTASRGAE